MAPPTLNKNKTLNPYELRRGSTGGDGAKSNRSTAAKRLDNTQNFSKEDRADVVETNLLLEKLKLGMASQIEKQGHTP